MDTILMDSVNNEISDLHIILLNLLDKTNLNRSDKYVALSNLSIYYTGKIVEKSYESNKLKVSAPTWKEEFQSPDGSYSASYIEEYFQYIIKKYKTVIDYPSLKIYVNKITNRVTYKIKTESWTFNSWNKEVTWKHQK